MQVRAVLQISTLYQQDILYEPTYATHAKDAVGRLRYALNLQKAFFKPPKATKASAASAAGDGAGASTSAHDAAEDSNAGAEANVQEEGHECMICLSEIEEEGMFSVCGHLWCTDCHDDMLKMASHQAPFKCPSCRKFLKPRSDVTHVTLGQQEGTKMKRVLNGSYGTKINAVVCKVLDILEEDPNDKVRCALPSEIVTEGYV